MLEPGCRSVKLVEPLQWCCGLPLGDEASSSAPMWDSPGVTSAHGGALLQQPRPISCRGSRLVTEGSRDQSPC